MSDDARKIPTSIVGAASCHRMRVVDTRPFFVDLFETLMAILTCPHLLGVPLRSVVSSMPASSSSLPVSSSSSSFSIFIPHSDAPVRDCIRISRSLRKTASSGSLLLFGCSRKRNQVLDIKTYEMLFADKDAWRFI